MSFFQFLFVWLINIQNIWIINLSIRWNPFDTNYDDFFRAIKNHSFFCKVCFQFVKWMWNSFGDDGDAWTHLFLLEKNFIFSLSLFVCQNSDKLVNYFTWNNHHHCSVKKNLDLSQIRQWSRWCWPDLFGLKIFMFVNNYVLCFSSRKIIEFYCFFQKMTILYFTW